MSNVIYLHKAKYKKVIEASKKDITLIVGSLANLLKVKPITYAKYKAFMPSKILNYVYVIHDIINEKLNKNEASWQILLIYYRNNVAISLGARAKCGEKNYTLGPLYIGGNLYFTSPTIHDVFSHASSYITNNIFPKLKNYE